MLPDVAIQLDELREVRLPSKHVLDAAPIEVESVRRKLKSGIGNAAFHVRQKAARRLGGSLADYARHNKFGFRVKGNELPLVSKIGRIANAHLPLFLADKAPNFVGLYVADTDIANKRVQLRFRPLRCRQHQRQNRTLVQSSQPGDGANAHSLKHHRKGFSGNLGIGVVGSEFGFVLGERNFAGCAAIPLNVALSVAAKLAGRVVTAFARHVISPLALSGETSHNIFGSRAWFTPRFGLPRNLFKQEAGRLVSDYGLGWGLNRDLYGLTSSETDFDSDNHAVFILPESPVRAGLSYLKPKSSAKTPATFTKKQIALGLLRKLFRERLSACVSANPLVNGFVTISDGRFRLSLADQPLQDCVDSGKRVGITLQVNPRIDNRLPNLNRRQSCLARLSQSPSDGISESGRHHNLGHLGQLCRGFFRVIQHVCIRQYSRLDAHDFPVNVIALVNKFAQFALRLFKSGPIGVVCHV
jgi:hypothetical protein